MGAHQKHYLKVNPYLDIISGIAVVLSFSDGLIKIIGREGSGKSVLTQLLAAELIEEDQEVVIFSDIPHSEQELHDPISQQLHLNLGSNADFFEALNRHIQERPFDQQKLILVFDDADQIPDDCFAAIRHLFEQNYHDRPEVSMVFAGSELLDQKLNEPDNLSFNKNIILNFEVKPMNRSELEAFCNAYLVEMGLSQKHRLGADDLDDIFAETQGLPGKIPELIYAIIDREAEQKKASEQAPEEKKIIKKLVVVDDDPEPELAGLSVEDREQVLTAFKDQVPWRWQSNGVGIAVVVLFLVVAYGYFVPEENRLGTIVIFPPPDSVPGQLSAQERLSLAETLAQQPLEMPSPAVADSTEPESGAPAVLVESEDIADTGIAEPAPEAAAVAEVTPAPESDSVPLTEPEPLTPEVAETPAAASAAETAAPAPEIAAVPETAPEPEPDVVPVEEPESGDSVETVSAIDQDVAALPEPETASAGQAVSADPAPRIAETPRPLPVATTPAAPATDSRTFVNDWLQAWERQDAASYIDAYAAGFVPAGGMSQTAWRDDRELKIRRPDSIAIQQEDFEILSTTADETTVRVQFTYASPTYADRTVKELVLVTENGDWAIQRERNISVETLSSPTPATEPTMATIASMPMPDDESGFDARIRQVLAMVSPPSREQLNTPVGMFINNWLDAWKSQDVESYFRHYADGFKPAQFNSLTDWRADRIRKINDKRFIDIAFDDIEVLDESGNSARVRFWLSYASSFYLDRTLKEVVITTGNQPGILQERNLEVEIIPFYP